MSSPSRRELNRRERESRLLDAALRVFSRHGYAAATMDEIATEAQLSKPTLYQYFASKDELFKAMMTTPRDTMALAIDNTPGSDHVTQLWRFAWAYAQVVMQAEFLSLARLIIGDAHRFPEIGQAYQASGPDRVLKDLTEFMARQGKLGYLLIDDAELAAEDFWGLILSAPRNKALHIPSAMPDTAELARYIHNGIRVFLKAYSTNSSSDLERLSRLIDSDTRKNE